MGYTEQTLVRDERVVHRGRAHWAIWILPVFSLLLPLFTGYGWLLSCGLFLHAAFLALGYEMVVTSERVVMRKGIIMRHVVEVSLTHADTITFDQSINGRLLDFGSVRVSSNSAAQSFEWLADPIAFRNAVHTAAKDRLDSLRVLRLAA